MISAAKLSLLLSAMAIVESGGDPDAYNAREQAHGILQIRRCVVQDVNRYRFHGYLLRDAYDPKKAHDIASEYLRLWCSTARRYGYEDAARIHNGGPDGWWKLSTLPYWAKVKKELERRGLDSRDTILETPKNPQWQLPPISPSPAARSASIPATAGASLSQSDLVTTFRFALNASEAKELRSVSITFTIRPSASKPAASPASPPPTSLPAKILNAAVAFEFHWNDTR